MSYTRITLAISLLFLVLIGSIPAVSADTYLDTEPPIVTITTPATWESSVQGSNNVNISGRASDNSFVVRVRWENQFGQSGTCAGTSSWSVSLSLEQGDNLICITAEDSAGNVGTASVLIRYSAEEVTRPPSITGLTPAYAPNTASVPITITGARFRQGATVQLRKSGSAKILAMATAVVSSGRISCVLPLQDVDHGLYNVVVTNPDRKAAIRIAGFAVGIGDLIVDSITSNTAFNATPAIVRDLSGRGFVAGATVKLTRAGEPDVIATGVTVFTPTKIACTLPIIGVAPGDWDVVVTNPNRRWGKLAAGYTITSAMPSINSVTPAGAACSDVAVVSAITGANFLPGASVSLTRSGKSDIAAGNVEVKSSSSISCTFNLSGVAFGAWNVVVTNPDNCTAKKINAFTVLGQAPSVLSIAPDAARNTGSVLITDLLGSGFAEGARVKISKSGQEDIWASGVNVASAEKIICSFDLSGAQTGTWSVTVINPDSQQATLPESFIIIGGATVTGSVVLKDYLGSSESALAYIELQSGLAVYASTCQLSDLGEFTLYNVAPGTYTLTIKVSHWLSNSLVMSVENADVVLPALDLENGDIDQSDRVDMADMEALEEQYMKLPLEQENCADINGDGQVDNLDREILERNMGKHGTLSGNEYDLSGE